MKENCLTCKFEPDWGEWAGRGQYTRCSGECKFPLVLVLPSCYRLTGGNVTRYKSDDSFDIGKCFTWEQKNTGG